MIHHSFEFRTLEINFEDTGPAITNEPNPTMPREDQLQLADIAHGDSHIDYVTDNSLDPPRPSETRHCFYLQLGFAEHGRRRSLDWRCLANGPRT